MIALTLASIALLNIPGAAADCQCTDQADWTTTAGYDCTGGYTSTADCETYGAEADANGVLPASACCICGGGTCVASAPTAAPTVAASTAATTVAAPTAAPTVAAPTAACECTDQAGWITTAGYGCVNGYTSPDDCETYGTDTDANGIFPATACCICGGGTCVAGSSATATQVVQEITQSIPG